MKKKIREIGEARKLDFREEEVIVHIQGKPIEMAKLLKRLIEEEGISLTQAAKRIGISKATASKLLNVYENLLPELVEKVEKGEIGWAKAYYLSRLPSEKQKQYLDKIEEGESVKVEEIVEEVKKELLEVEEFERISWEAPIEEKKYTVKALDSEGNTINQLDSTSKTEAIAFIESNLEVEKVAKIILEVEE